MLPNYFARAMVKKRNFSMFRRRFRVSQKSCRPCENGDGLKIASGVMAGMTGVRAFPDENLLLTSLELPGTP